MKVTVKKYGRWDETCNWQLMGQSSKKMTEEQFKMFSEYAGYVYTEQYNEWHLVSDNKLLMTVVTVKEA